MVSSKFVRPCVGRQREIAGERESVVAHGEGCFVVARCAQRVCESNLVAGIEGQACPARDNIGGEQTILRHQRGNAAPNGFNSDKTERLRVTRGHNKRASVLGLLRHLCRRQSAKEPMLRDIGRATRAASGRRQ